MRVEICLDLDNWTGLLFHNVNYKATITYGFFLTDLFLDITLG